MATKRGDVNTKEELSNLFFKKKRQEVNV